MNTLIAIVMVAQVLIFFGLVIFVFWPAIKSKDVCEERCQWVEWAQEIARRNDNLAKALEKIVRSETVEDAQGLAQRALKVLKD